MKRTLSLLPPLKAKPLATKRLLIAVAAGAALYAAALAGVLLLNNYQARNLDNAISDLRGKKLQLQQYMSASAPRAGATESADPAIMEKMRNTPPWDAIFSELSLIVPGEVWLETVESPDARHVRLKGYAQSPSDVARLIERLERSRYFDNVEIVFTQKGEKANAFELRTEMTWT
jgi:Tfp pilus assembly protein PilN